MNDYLHHVPGRLRVRSDRLRRNQKAASEIRVFLGALDGIVDFSHNPVTGSVTVLYDRANFDPAAFMLWLRDRSYIGVEPSLNTRSALERSARGAGKKIGGAVLGMIVEKLLEQTARAMIAAVI